MRKEGRFYGVRRADGRDMTAGMRFRMLLMLAGTVSVLAAPLKDKALQAYFEAEVAKIEANCLNGPMTLEEWQEQKERRRAELFEMLSLAPLPPKSDLHASVTGTVEAEEFVVEKLHFQSLPGLYVTGNFYRPKRVEQPLPTILYVCGHALVKSNGVSYGNKTAYQHHGAWFARNGYACLTIDTVQLGEIEGLHHGTYREGMWWWNSRGYTPAGVEAWNCIRALDYLETRPEVDKNRFGVTGRSGGGAYSWWVAALDDRIKVAAPVAGITDLRNHIVDGVVEGHCDCMFFLNARRWDYPMLAALVAPRPLLICNSDKDTIFPLDGVVRTHAKVAPIYRLYNASTNLGLLITEGPHKDTQDLQLPVFRWFNRFLKGSDPLIDMAATRFFEPRELRVFEKLPEDERTSRIHESFVPKAERPAVSPAALRETVFGGWPRGEELANAEVKRISSSATEVHFRSQEHVPLSMLMLGDAATAAKIELTVLDQGAKERDDWRPGTDEVLRAILFVRGADAPGNEPRESVQIRRRYMLAGQTLDGMRVWDILRAVEVLGRLDATRGKPIEASAAGRHASNLLLAALFDARLGKLKVPPLAEWAGAADYLNLDRVSSLEAVYEKLASEGRLAK